MTVGLPVAGSNGGFFTVSGDGTVIFDPAGAFADLGPNEFRDTGVAVTVSDAVGATATATVIARVRANASANPAPVTVAPLPDKAVTSGVPVVPFSVSGAFGDPGDVLAYSAAGLPAGLSIDAASGIVSGTPTAGPGTAFVLVTATDTAGETAVASFSLTIDAALSAPVLLAPPVIAGTAAVGTTLTTVPGRWAGRPVPSVSHQWRRNGLPIAGATGPSYIVTATDAAASLTLEETAVNGEGSATAVSVAVNVPDNGAPLPPAAAGALSDQSYTQGVTIAPFDTGADFTGTGLSFALAPASGALPAGLGLDATTGVISGTPTELAAGRAIVVRATNAAGFADSAFSLTVAAADSTAPSLASALPANGATDVPISTTPVLSFSEDISRGSGSITLRDVVGAVDVEIFDAATSGQLAISGADLTITPSVPLQPGRAYAVRISPGAIEDLAGNPFAGITDDATLNFTTAVPSHSANFSSVNADGWTALYPSPLAVVNAGTNNALVTQEAFTVTRAGFDTSGAATTFDEDLKVMARERLAYPNQTSLTTDQVTLSDFVYSSDTVAGATNNSTLAVPKPIAMWLDRDLVAAGNAYTARLAVAHRHARSGRPVAAVKFIATDGTSTVEQVVSSMTKVTYANGSNLSAPCFEATLDLSTLADGLVTIDAVIYPWVGTAFTISTDASTYPSPNLTVLKVYKGTLSPTYAYVNAATGNDGTGVAGSALVAELNPFATIGAAASAIQAANTNFPGTVANGVIRLTDDAVHTISNISASVDGPVPLIIENDPANATKAVLTDGGASRSNYLTDTIVLRDLTLRVGAASVIFLDSAASGTDYSHMLAMERCTFDANGFSPWGAWLYRTGRTWLIDCDGDVTATTKSFSTAQKMSLCIGSKNAVADSVFSAVASTGEGLVTSAIQNANRPAPQGSFYGWNTLSTNVASNKVFVLDSTVDDRGLALVGNVFEHYGGTTAPAFSLSADSIVDPVANVVATQNTVVGSRSNFMYQDTGTVTVSKVAVDRFSVHWKANTKTDVFGADGNLTGNWTTVHRVGYHTNAYLQGSNSASDNTVGSWMGEVAEIGLAHGDDTTPLAADWVSDASSVGAGGSGLGGGDYRPGPSTALPTIPPGLAPYPFDQKGAAVPDDGTARVGALQP